MSPVTPIEPSDDFVICVRGPSLRTRLVSTVPVIFLLRSKRFASGTNNPLTLDQVPTWLVSLGPSMHNHK
jgi:hypothetical protein